MNIGSSVFYFDAAGTLHSALITKVLVELDFVNPANKLSGKQGRIDLIYVDDRGKVVMKNGILEFVPCLDASHNRFIDSST